MEREAFELALKDLRAYCIHDGKSTHFAVFARYDLAEDTRPTYNDLAQEYGIPVTTVTNYVAWTQREFRRQVRERMGW
jgi:hypothetical protein